MSFEMVYEMATLATRIYLSRDCLFYQSSPTSYILPHGGLDGFPLCGEYF
jgi:hypothetical protein